MHKNDINYHLDLALALFSSVILTKNIVLTFLIVAPVATIRGNTISIQFITFASTVPFCTTLNSTEITRHKILLAEESY